VGADSTDAVVPVCADPSWPPSSLWMNAQARWRFDVDLAGYLAPGSARGYAQIVRWV
jgi:hypothetical protein